MTMAQEYTAYLDAASALLGLPIAPEHREAVEAAFLVLRAQAELVTNFALPEETEAAPRYTP
jgi:1-carboxybiuret hydrolase subunit AtzG-like